MYNNSNYIINIYDEGVSIRVACLYCYRHVGCRYEVNGWSLLPKLVVKTKNYIYKLYTEIEHSLKRTRKERVNVIKNGHRS